MSGVAAQDRKLLLSPRNTCNLKLIESSNKQNGCVHVLKLLKTIILSAYAYIWCIQACILSRNLKYV